MSEFRVILNTCPNTVSGGKIARVLVTEELAACVNIVDGVQSIYRWQGEICEDSECLLVIKTTKARVPELKERLVSLHPYECPEVIELTISDGHKPYLDWITQQT